VTILIPVIMLIPIIYIENETIKTILIVIIILIAVFSSLAIKNILSLIITHNIDSNK